MAARRVAAVIAILLCLCICFINPCTNAVSTEDAHEPIVTDKKCSLTVAYRYDATAFSDQAVKLYQIADVSADFQYTLTPAFSATGLILNGIRTNGEWNVIRSTLEAHIVANAMIPTATAATDEQGSAVFTALKPGLYLVSSVTAEQDDMTCYFDSTLVALPGLDANGFWQYEVTVTAKPEVLPPVNPDEEIQLKVLKLWKGDEGRTDRPASIEVEIFRDSVSVETVILSEDNHWSYTWIADDDGSTWTVVERNVPSGYAMTVEQRESAFVLINTWSPENPDTPKPPQTGDTANILAYTILMYVSGALLIIFGLIGKRKHNEQAK